MLKWILAVVFATTFSVAVLGCGERQPDRPQAAPEQAEPGSPPQEEPGSPPAREPGS